MWRGDGTSTVLGSGERRDGRERPSFKHPNAIPLFPTLFSFLRTQIGKQHLCLTLQESSFRTVPQRSKLLDKATPSSMSSNTNFLDVRPPSPRSPLPPT